MKLRFIIPSPPGGIVEVESDFIPAPDTEISFSSKSKEGHFVEGRYKVEHVEYKVIDLPDPTTRFITEVSLNRIIPPASVGGFLG